MKTLATLCFSSALLIAGTASANHVFVCVARGQNAPPRQTARAATGKGSTLVEAKADAMQACQAANGSAVTCALEKCSM